MIEWLNSWWTELRDWLLQLWHDTTEFITDLPKQAFAGIIDALASLIESIPVPEFVQTGGLSQVMSALPDSVQYFLDASGITGALSILGLGFIFRMTRKLLTLGQW